MVKRTVLFFSLAIAFTVVLALVITAQGPGGAPPTPVQPLPSPNVSSDRLLQAAREPQNWLMYSGNYMSQRHSPLTLITTGNAQDLVLKWVFQSRSLEKSEVTPLVVDGTMYTVQSPND